MALRLRQLQNSIHFAPIARPFSFASAKSLAGKKFDGGDHAVERTDEKDPQSSASQSGMRKRQEDDGTHSQAMGERDTGGYNEKVQKENPKAPKPIIGMNDERGGKGR